MRRSQGAGPASAIKRVPAALLPVSVRRGLVLDRSYWSCCDARVEVGSGELELSDVQIIELEPLDPVAESGPPARWYARERLLEWIKARRWWLGTVVLPAAVSGLYMAVLASDRYESEARFVVRSPSATAANQISSLVQGSGIVRSADDAYIVHAYMKSRDVVRYLVDNKQLLQRLDRSGADVFWAYPGFLSSANNERLWRYFQSLLSIDFDNSTGITTLKVQAFAPEDAQALAEGLLESSENLINVISRRAQEQTLKTASSEVEASRAKAEAALERISAFRKEHQLIDPSRTSTAANELLSRLAVEVARMRADLEELRSSAASSPQARTLERRIAALEEQMAVERRALAGSDTSLAPLIAEYERLALEREFAERTFASARTAFDLARIDADRQRLFIEQISVPSRPDYPKYPYRFLSPIGVLAVCWFIFAIARRLVADARGHAGN